MSTNKRKLDHIKISLGRKVEEGSTGLDDISFKDISFVHASLPEKNLSDIDLTCPLFGRKFSMPLMITGMTGGTPAAQRINENLAAAAEKFNIPIGVGSQRAAIEDPSLEYTYDVKKKSPGVFLIANIGLVQFNMGYTKNEVSRAIEMINADAIAIHLNPLQEACQPEGDTDWKGCLANLKKICRIKKPVIVKETGAGINREIAAMIEKSGASAIDISGSGGTSWSLVESYRSGHQFSDWGIPTSISLIETLSSVKIPVIASGGIRNGQQIAKCISLGAAMTGSALPFLKEAVKNKDNVYKKLYEIEKEIRTSFFLAGASSISDIKKKPLVITGKTGEWLRERGINTSRFAMRS